MRTQEKRSKIELTPFDKLLEAVGWCIILVIWIALIISYAKLPEIIPTHYNAQGVIDGYKNKSSIWILPIVASALFIGMTFLNGVPHIFNYLTAITEENALQQYSIMTKMMRFVKLALVIVMGSLVFKTISIARGMDSGLESFFTPMILGTLFIPLIYFLFVLIKNR